MRQLKIGTSWVRGVVGDALTPELIVNFACAFGTWCDGGPVVLGRDTRRSSAMLRASILSGLLLFSDLVRSVQLPVPYINSGGTVSFCEPGPPMKQRPCSYGLRHGSQHLTASVLYGFQSGQRFKMAVDQRFISQRPQLFGRLQLWRIRR